MDRLSWDVVKRCFPVTCQDLHFFRGLLLSECRISTSGDTFRFEHVYLAFLAFCGRYLQPRDFLLSKVLDFLEAHSSYVALVRARVDLHQLAQQHGTIPMGIPEIVDTIKDASQPVPACLLRDHQVLDMDKRCRGAKDGWRNLKEGEFDQDWAKQQIEPLAAGPKLAVTGRLLGLAGRWAEAGVTVQRAPATG